MAEAEYFNYTAAKLQKLPQAIPAKFTKTKLGPDYSSLFSPGDAKTFELYAKPRGKRAPAHSKTLIRGGLHTNQQTRGKYKMKSEYMAIIEPAPEGGYWAISPEIPGANGQGETIEEAKESLQQAIELIQQDKHHDYHRAEDTEDLEDATAVTIA